MKKAKQLNYKAVFSNEAGKTVLIGNEGIDFVTAVGKANCENTFTSQTEKINYFKARISEKKLDPKNFVIVIINVDSKYGDELAKALMPGEDWQQFRDKGQIPFARGFVGKDYIREFVSTIDKDASIKITSILGVTVVIFDHSVVEIFSV